MSKTTSKEKLLILKYVIVTLLIAALFAAVIFGFHNRLHAEITDSMVKGGKLSATEVSDLLDNYLDMNIDCVSLTAYALDKMITEKQPDSNIQAFLTEQSTAFLNIVQENVTGLYGYINGKFFSGTGWVPEPGFDATIRPWYTKPMSQPGELTILDPYVDVQTGDVMLAVGKTLCDGSSVVSVDVSLDRIQAITEKATMFENSDTVMILNETGIVVANSDPKQIGRDYGTEKDTFGAAVFGPACTNDSDHFELFFENRRYIIYEADIRNGWHCISVMDVTDKFWNLELLFILTSSAVLVGLIILAVISTNSGRRQIRAEQLNSQLAAISDIYVTLHEINFLKNRFSVIRSSIDEVSDYVSKTRGDCQDMINKIMERRTDPSSRKAILEFVDFSTLNHRLLDRSTITTEFLSSEGKWRRARFIVSERTPGGKVARAMYLVEDIDAEKRERDITNEAVSVMNEQIASVANIYFSMHDIDLPNDTFSEIKTKVQKVSDLIGGRKDHAQETIYYVMDNMTAETSRETIHEFVNLSTLNERLKDTNTVTEEFLSHKGVWSRARFVVSKRAPDGSIEHVLWLVEGIDAEKRRREKLISLSERAVAASEAKSSFLTKVSHNIRMPVHAILGMNELILRENKDKNIRLYAENIRNSGSTLLGLANDLLDISDLETGKTRIAPCDYDVSCMINDLANMVQPEADSRGLTLTLDIGSDIPRMLHGDVVHLKQVIMNLFSNAVNNTQKGSITFSVNYEDIPDAENQIILSVSVKDTGPGMEPDEVGKLLSPDSSLDDTENMGISIAAALLKMMGSSLCADSMPGLGSMLYFRIKQDVVNREPLGNYEAAYRLAVEKRSTYKEKFKAPDASALVVDDIPINLMFMNKLLGSTGMRTDTALSGEQAVKLAKENKYDIIILDQIMPEKSGVETLQEIRGDEDSKNVRTPAVCLTANAGYGVRKQYMREGFDDYLAKPLDPEKLEEMLLKYLPEEKIHFTDAKQ